jgi:hypothetical protein
MHMQIFHEANFKIKTVFCATALVICAVRIYYNFTYCCASGTEERTVALRH